MTVSNLPGGAAPGVGDERAPTWYWELFFALLREAAAIRRRDPREFPATSEHAFVYDRYRDSHDLWHVLTGYGTDMAGEAGSIAWTYAQTGNRGYLLIFLLNALICLKRGRPDVIRTCWQGYRHGKRSPLLLAVDWTPHLERPIDAVRRTLGLEVARPYPVFHMADGPGAPDELAA